mmetsp:Transcript_65360/g.206527  ORF Transcript_65360/g.206527 Transcript_65360/m.206527 type:complete len:348 (-) Transcript_65360:12-1055(-)
MGISGQGTRARAGAAPLGISATRAQLLRAGRRPRPTGTGLRTRGGRALRGALAGSQVSGPGIPCRGPSNGQTRTRPPLRAAGGLGLGLGGARQRVITRPRFGRRRGCTPTRRSSSSPRRCQPRRSRGTTSRLLCTMMARGLLGGPSSRRPQGRPLPSPRAGPREQCWTPSGGGCPWGGRGCLGRPWRPPPRRPSSSTTPRHRRAPKAPPSPPASAWRTSSPTPSPPRSPSGGPRRCRGLWRGWTARTPWSCSCAWTSGARGRRSPRRRRPRCPTTRTMGWGAASRTSPRSSRPRPRTWTTLSSISSRPPTRRPTGPRGMGWSRVRGSRGSRRALGRAPLRRETPQKT